jgi:hypothetical protein
VSRIAQEEYQHADWIRQAAEAVTPEHRAGGPAAPADKASRRRDWEPDTECADLVR